MKVGINLNIFTRNIFFNNIGDYRFRMINSNQPCNKKKYILS